MRFPAETVSPSKVAAIPPPDPGVANWLNLKRPQLFTVLNPQSTLPLTSQRMLVAWPGVVGGLKSGPSSKKVPGPGSGGGGGRGAPEGWIRGAKRNAAIRI